LPLVKLAAYYDFISKAFSFFWTQCSKVQLQVCKCASVQLYYVLDQHGPTTDLGAILQKHDNSQATSNKLM